MSIECSECEHDLRAGHADTCSRAPRYLVIGHGETPKPDMKIVTGTGNVREAVALMMYSFDSINELDERQNKEVDALLEGFFDEDDFDWTLGGTRFEIEFEIGGIEITRIPSAHDSALPPPASSQDDARDAARYRELNTPEIHDFLAAVEREALHQRDRWGAEHDVGKQRGDWMNLIVVLLGKAVAQGHWEGKHDKLLHHIITAAAALLNWHAAEIGADTRMRPGIAAPADDGEGE